MTIAALALLEAVRDQLDDHGGDTGTPSAGYYAYWQESDAGCLWKNAELTRYLNQTLRELGQRQPVLEGSTDYQIQMVAGIRQYELPYEIVRIRAVHRTSDGAALLKVTLAEMHRGQEAAWRDREALPVTLDQDWRSETGWPTHYLLDEQIGYLSVYPTPVAGKVDVLQLAVSRTYLVPVIWANLAREATPLTPLDDVPDHYFDALLAGVCARAYRKRDADTFAPKLAAEFEAEFNRRVGPPLSLAHLEADWRWADTPGDTLPRIFFAR